MWVCWFVINQSDNCSDKLHLKPELAFLNYTHNKWLTLKYWQWLQQQSLNAGSDNSASQQPRLSPYRFSYTGAASVCSVTDCDLYSSWALKNSSQSGGCGSVYTCGDTVFDGWFPVLSLATPKARWGHAGAGTRFSVPTLQVYISQDTLYVLFQKLVQKCMMQYVQLFYFVFKQENKNVCSVVQGKSVTCLTVGNRTFLLFTHIINIKTFNAAA